MYVKVRVCPGAKREEVVKKGEVFCMSVREPAERNCANNRVRELLARALRVQLSAVRLIAGHRSSSKVFSVEGILGS